MVKILVTVASSPLPLPPGVAAAGKYDFALFLAGNTTPVQTSQSDTPDTSFDVDNSVPANVGDYTVAVRRLSDTGDAITSPITSSPITVSAASAGNFDAPSSITVALG